MQIKIDPRGNDIAIYQGDKFLVGVKPKSEWLNVMLGEDKKVNCKIHEGITLTPAGHCVACDNDAMRNIMNPEGIIEYPKTKRHGSSIFYNLLESLADTHDKKSHDYASDGDPFKNYKFAGMLSKIFNNPDDSGFIGRIGEKIYRLANLENENKVPKNETIEDTEVDICTITVLWMAMRRERRLKNEVK